MKLTGPDPEFPTTETPAGRRSSDPRPPTPGGQPDPPDPSPANGPALRWARDPHDSRLHTVASVDVLLAKSRGYIECLCEHSLPADVSLEDRPSGLLCLLAIACAPVPIGIMFSGTLPPSRGMSTTKEAQMARGTFAIRLDGDNNPAPTALRGVS